MKAPGRYLSERIRAFFRETGVHVHSHPHLFFWIPVVVTVVSWTGLLRFHEENRIWYLYSPSSAPSHYEHGVANEFFNDRGGKFWLEVTMTASDMGNLLRPDYLDGIEYYSSFLQYNLSVPCDKRINPSGQCSFNDLCTGNCNDNQVIPIFNLIYRNASQRLHPNFRLTYPTMHLYNDEYYVGEHFAGVSLDEVTNRISSVKVIVLYFRTDKQDELFGETLYRWEEQVIDYTRSFQHPTLNMTCNSDRAIAEEVRRNGMACLPYFVLSVTVVYLFIVLTNQREHFRQDHSLVMAFLGIIGPLMAVSTTFCVLFGLGVPFNSITLVMPFLIIGVGADDVFIIIHACRKCHKSAPLKQQIAEAMEEAGPSITVTSATNILSFSIGILTPTPAISLFCLYTACALAVDYVYQLTFFVAALVYEEQRQIRRAAAETEKPPIDTFTETQQISRSLEYHNGFITKYCKILVKWQTRLFLLLTLLVYWSISVLGCSTMQIKMDTTHLVMKDSPLNNIAWLYEKFLWSEGQQVLVFVNAPPDLSIPANQRSILSLVDAFERLPYSMGRNSTSFWLRHFLSQYSLYSEDRSFYPQLQEWLQDSEGGGYRWNDMIRLGRASNDSITRIQKFMFATGCAMGKNASWEVRDGLQKSWREEALKWTPYNVSVFQAYSFYVDQIDSIGPTTLSTVAIAAITMDIACFLMIPSASSIISSSLAMLSINIGVFGFLSLWGVNLDPIAMCTTLMSIGFSVDFTAHISYHFYRSPNAAITNEERLADALKCIGWPMIQAGCSTFLCICPLMIIDSYTVRVFVKTIALVVCLGLLHGIIFLPALLITVQSSSENKKQLRSLPTAKTENTCARCDLPCSCLKAPTISSSSLQPMQPIENCSLERRHG